MKRDGTPRPTSNEVDRTVALRVEQRVKGVADTIVDPRKFGFDPPPSVPAQPEARKPSLDETIMRPAERPRPAADQFARPPEAKQPGGPKGPRARERGLGFYKQLLLLVPVFAAAIVISVGYMGNPKPRPASPRPTAAVSPPSDGANPTVAPGPQLLYVLPERRASQPERVAAKSVIAGQYRVALARYQALSMDDPSNPLFAGMVVLLERKITTLCAGDARSSPQCMDTATE